MFLQIGKCLFCKCEVASGIHTHFCLAFRAGDGKLSRALWQTQGSAAVDTLEIHVRLSVAPLVFLQSEKYSDVFYHRIFTAACGNVARKDAKECPRNRQQRDEREPPYVKYGHDKL